MADCIRRPTQCEHGRRLTCLMICSHDRPLPPTSCRWSVKSEPPPAIFLTVSAAPQANGVELGPRRSIEARSVSEGIPAFAAPVCCPAERSCRQIRLTPRHVDLYRRSEQLMCYPPASVGPVPAERQLSELQVRYLIDMSQLKPPAAGMYAAVV